MRFRKLRIAWSVGCAIACVLLVVLWVRSRHASDAAVKKVDTISNQVVDTTPVKASDIESIAIKEVERRNGVAPKNLTSRIVRSGDKESRVQVFVQPGYPGGHWGVTIDASGKVTEYDEGL